MPVTRMPGQADGDRDAAVARLAIERGADVDADRTERRIITQAKARAILPVGQARDAAGGQRAAVEERHHAEIAAEQFEPDARLERELGQAAATDRIAVDVARAKPLVAIAAHRAAAARIEAPRRCDRVAVGPRDGAQPQSPGKHHGVGDPAIGAGIDLHAGIGEAAALERQFGTDPPEQAETFRRVEQIVSRVIAEAGRHRADEKGPQSLGAGGNDGVALARGDQFAAQAPGPFFCQMKLLCRSIPPDSDTVRAS